MPLFIVFIVSLGVASLFAVIGVDAHHDGIMLKPAIDLANGKMLYRDSFSMYAPGTTLLQALAVKVFGEYLITIRLLTAFFYALIACVLYLSWMRLLPKRSLAVLSCLIWLILSQFLLKYEVLILFPWPTVYATFWVVLTIYLLILQQEKNRLAHWFLIGMATSLTFWFKQNYGGTLLCSVLFYLILDAALFKKEIARGLKKLGIFLSGYCLVLFSFVIWLYSGNALHAYWMQAIKWPMAFAREHGTNTFAGYEILVCMFRQGMKDPFGSFLFTLFPMITLWFFARTVVTYFRHKALNTRDNYMIILTVTALFNWANYYPVDAAFDMHMASAPMVGLFVLSIYEISVDCISGLNCMHVYNIAVSIFRMLIEDLNKILSYLTFNVLSPKPQKISRGAVIFVAILSVLLIRNVSRRIKGSIDKIEQNHFQIESVPVLSGMLMEKADFNFYGKIAALVKKHFAAYPDSNIVNLTASALFTDFKKRNYPDLPMYVYWRWLNYYLYPDYNDKLLVELRNNKDLVFSDYFMIGHYVPQRCFYINRTLQKPFVLMEPGIKENIFNIRKIKEPSNNVAFGITMLDPQKIEINSITVYIVNDQLIPKEFSSREFEYEILPSVLNDPDRLFLEEIYTKSERGHIYRLDRTLNKTEESKLRSIFIDRFLNDKYLAVFNTLKNSQNAYISIKLNGQLLIKTEQKNNLRMVVTKKDDIEMVLPYLHMPGTGEELAKIRINFDNNRYAELYEQIGQ